MNTKATIEDVMAELLNSGKVNVSGFGSFEIKRQEARRARNPATGGMVDVPAKNVVRFKPFSGLKDAVNE